MGNNKNLIDLSVENFKTQIIYTVEISNKNFDTRQEVNYYKNKVKYKKPSIKNFTDIIKSFYYFN